MPPKLLYVSNVPVEASYHGSALLYRLLQTYPADRLCIVESSLYVSQPQRRLTGVRYEVLPAGWERLCRTRLAWWYSSLLFFRAGSWGRRVERVTQGFEAEAVLSVAHGNLWRAAASYAERHRLPLHLICHDEVTNTVMSLPSLKPGVERVFGAVYRAAASRLCVSPYMREDYRVRFGVDAEVLYPSRAETTPVFNAPPDHLASLPEGLRVAFAGTINSGGHTGLLQSMARALGAIGGKLLLFGPISKEAADQSGLLLPNVELRGLLPSHELIETLRRQADVLYVPMSFAEQDRQAMRTNFPSKLTDYSAVGLPILIQGPADCSAVRWARENEGVAVVVEEPGELSSCLARLAGDAAWRQQLASEALRVGALYFGASAAREKLMQTLGRHS